VKKAGEHWKQLCKDSGLSPTCDRTLFVSSVGGMIDKLAPGWDKLGLDHHAVDLAEIPEVYRGGKIEKAVVQQVSETTFPVREVLTRFAKDVAKQVISGEWLSSF
jgi:hypothetical protein